MTKNVPSRNPLLYCKIVGKGLGYEIYTVDKEKEIEIIQRSKRLAYTVGSINYIDKYNKFKYDNTWKFRL